MTEQVKLSGELVAAAQCRVGAGGDALMQIEQWVRIGRVMEQNPDMPWSMIRDIFVGMDEGADTEYQFCSEK